jgi:hypothetical protein
MQGSEDGDLGDVAMPGFIDILSSVITVFMFFMLITSAIMFFLSLQMKKNLEQESHKEAKTEASRDVQDLIKKLKSGEVSVDQLASDTPATPDSQAQPQAQNQPQPSNAVQQTPLSFGKSEIQEIKSDTAYNEMVIIYTDRGITVSDDTRKKVMEFINSLEKKSNGKPLSIAIDVPDNPTAPTLSVSREIALGRTLNLRNVFLSDKKTNHNISIHTVAALAYNNSYDWIKIHVDE